MANEVAEAVLTFLERRRVQSELSQDREVGGPLHEPMGLVTQGHG